MVQQLGWCNVVRTKAQMSRPNCSQYALAFCTGYSCSGNYIVTSGNWRHNSGNWPWTMTISHVPKKWMQYFESVANNPISFFTQKPEITIHFYIHHLYGLIGGRPKPAKLRTKYCMAWPCSIMLVIALPMPQTGSKFVMTVLQHTHTHRQQKSNTISF